MLHEARRSPPVGRGARGRRRRRQQQERHHSRDLRLHDVRLLADPTCWPAKAQELFNKSDVWHAPLLQLRVPPMPRTQLYNVLAERKMRHTQSAEAQAEA
jgi:hypothetical protein